MQGSSSASTVTKGPASRLILSGSRRVSLQEHGVWGLMPELTKPSSYVDSRVDSSTFTMGNPMPESTLTLHAKVDFIPLTVT